MVPFAEGIIKEARRLIGLKEQPLGSNNGRQLRQVLSDTGFVPGQAWCFYFCVHCLKMGSGNNGTLPLSVLDTGSCQAAADHAARLQKLSDYPATGCIFVLPNKAGHFHHAGIVVAVDEGNQVIHTIEGNTNTDGSPQGFGVFSHVRPIHTQKYIVW